MNRAPTICLFLLLTLGPSAPAQQAGASFSESMHVRLVNVDVLVSDKKGSPVRGLAASDFELREDKKKVKISNFFAAGAGMKSSSEPSSLLIYVDERHLRVSNRDGISLIKTIKRYKRAIKASIEIR